MSQNNNREMTAPMRRHFLFTPDLLIPLLVLLASTLLFWLSDLDIVVQSYFYRSGEWKLGDYPLYSILYHWGNIPALLLVIGSLVAYILSYSKPRLALNRRTYVYLVLCLAIGPGLIVNTILKDQWGRPRPRELVQYGGSEQYERPLQIDPDSDGKSFPCGHATMGYYFFALALVIRKRKRLVSAIVMTGAAIYGSLIGLARMAQGGHFLSDVIWAGALVYLISYFLFMIVKPDEARHITPPGRLAGWKKLLMLILLVLIIFAVSLATPYTRKHSLRLSELLQDSTYYNLEFIAQSVALDVLVSDSTSFTANSQGFGAPGSKLRYSPVITSDRDVSKLSILQKQSGFFTEISSRANLCIDSTRCSSLSIKSRDLECTIDLSTIQVVLPIDIQAETVDLNVTLPEDFSALIYISEGISIQTNRKDLRISNDENIKSRYRVKAASGTINIE